MAFNFSPQNVSEFGVNNLNAMGLECANPPPVEQEAVKKQEEPPVPSHAQVARPATRGRSSQGGREGSR
jgi:hypothetical protein